MNRKLTGIVAAVALAAIGTAGLVVYVQSIEARALAGEQAVEVLVAAQAIPRGTSASDVAQMVRTEQVPAKVRANGALTDLDGVEGRVTSVAFLEGEQLTTARFIDPLQVGEVDVPGDLQQVTVQLSLDRAIGGRVAAGDTVGVVASFSDMAEGEDGGGGATSHMILHKVLVTRVASGDGVAPDPEDEGGNGPTAPGGTLLITLALEAPDVERVVFAAEHGSLWLSADPDDASESGTSIKTKESIYR